MKTNSNQGYKRLAQISAGEILGFNERELISDISNLVRVLFHFFLFADILKQVPFFYFILKLSGCAAV